MSPTALRSRGFAAASFAAALAVAIPAAQADGTSHRIDLGLFGGLHIFSNDNELGVADEEDANSLTNSVDIGVRGAYEVLNQLYAEGEVDFHPTAVRGTDISVLAIGWRAHLLYDLGSSAQRPFVLAGIGGLSSSSDDQSALANDTDFVVHVGTGLKFDITPQWGARADLRLSFPPSSDDNGPTTDLEFLLGVTYSMGVEPPPPPPPPDSDGDGVPDDRDNCPNQAEDLDGNEDEDGCPEEEAPADSDGDGLDDEQDQCPAEAEDRDGFQDEDGCPDVDNDGDGIPDSDDQCPGDGEDMDGFEDADGCPDADNDGDGIADTADQCPAEPETANGYQDGDGCPDEVPEEVKRYTGTIQGIRFALGSDQILPVSRPVLNRAAKVLTDYPDLRVEISGHTDSSGSAERNTTLSQARAESVKAYLVSQGIDEARLKAIGFGPSKPVADNATPAGRAQNRRVEFRLMGNNE
ncbi:OmpA family protein [Haliangium sp.]|uniref:OmpA family protein n=1 Tax=Haliangium sp. TaxID=2663208 RepID=UPI003D0AB248